MHSPLYKGSYCCAKHLSITVEINQEKLHVSKTLFAIFLENLQMNTA